MKKLFKLLTLVGAVAGITWVLRDQLLPGPSQPTSHPPAFRNPPAPPAPHAEAAPVAAGGFELGDDLTAVNGIGPVYAKRLAGAGVKSFRDLAAADANDLAMRTDLPKDRVADWIRKATDLA